MKKLSTRQWFVAACAVVAGALPSSASAADLGPSPFPIVDTIPKPQDTPFPGTIALHVDATDIERHIFNVSETVPVPAAIAQTGGDMVLLFPMWLPGDHSPTGPLDQFGGLTIESSGKKVKWLRDSVEVSAFHVNVPRGAHTIDVHFQLLSPASPSEGRVVITPNMLNVQWNAVTLYPAGYFTRQIKVAANLRLPSDWQYGTALRPTAGSSGNTVHFQPVSFNTLVDSPLFAGRYFRKIDLAPGATTSVSLNLVADRPEELNATESQIKAHSELVRQANILFGSHHYEHYDFLLALTSDLGGIGLEHHQSSENSGPRGYFTQWDKTFAGRDLLAHEFTHSWNGKFRRPQDLWAANFNTPQRGSGLWVYEGQTQYWGYVLAARSGLMTAPQAMDAIALVAATFETRAGRKWRPLIDTTNDPVIAQRAPLSWRSWQRSEDYYSEGQLLWLDADTLIRTMSGSKKSLDDFAKAFFGINDGSFVTVTYSFDDIVKALNEVQPYDWATFLRTRLSDTQPPTPLEGLERAGYKLIYTAEPSGFEKSETERRHLVDLGFSLGLVVGKDARLASVEWGSPAWIAGITRDEQIVAVNGEAYDADTLKDAVTQATAKNALPITLLLRKGDQFHTVSLAYHDGLKYPHLERIAGKDDLLSAILAPRHTP